MKAVDDNVHSPQCWQRNKGTFTTSSKKSSRRENFRSRAVRGVLVKVTKSFNKDSSPFLVHDRSLIKRTAKAAKVRKDRFQIFSPSIISDP